VSLRVQRPDGSMYENNDKCAMWLYTTATTARYLHLVPIWALEDHRNDAYVGYAPEKYSPSLSVSYVQTTGASLELPDTTDLPQYNLSYWNAAQRYRMEIWIEKSTMNDIIDPICEKYQIGFQSAMGQMSLHRVHQLVQRIKRDGRPCIIFYISDFDKAGHGMPVAMGVKLDWCLGEEGMTEEDVKLFPIALTEEQVIQYQLPRVPQKETIKETELFKDGAVELDALEALQPGVLRKIIVAALDCYYDHGLFRRVFDGRWRLEEELNAIRGKVLEKSKAEIDVVQEEHDRIIAEFDDRTSEYNRRLIDLSLIHSGRIE
jgi:hypothetical protein